MSSATRVPDVSFAFSTLPLHPTTYRGPLLAFTITAKTRTSKLGSRYETDQQFIKGRQEVPASICVC